MIHIKNKPTMKRLGMHFVSILLNALQSITAIILSHLCLYSVWKLCICSWNKICFQNCSFSHTSVTFSSPIYLVYPLIKSMLVLCSTSDRVVVLLISQKHFLSIPELMENMSSNVHLSRGCFKEVVLFCWYQQLVNLENKPSPVVFSASRKLCCGEIWTSFHFSCRPL